MHNEMDMTEFLFIVNKKTIQDRKSAARWAFSYILIRRFLEVKPSKLKIRRFQIPNDSNKERKGLMGIGGVISEQIVKFT